MATKLLDETRGEMKAAVGKLVQTLHKIAGSGFLEAVPQGKLEQVKSLLNL